MKLRIILQFTIGASNWQNQSSLQWLKAIPIFTKKTRFSAAVTHSRHVLKLHTCIYTNTIVYPICLVQYKSNFLREHRRNSWNIFKTFQAPLNLVLPCGYYVFSTLAFNTWFRTKLSMNLCMTMLKLHSFLVLPSAYL